MDAILFELKAAHLSVQRVGRAFAKPYGLTTARFDLMNALGVNGMLQKDLWKRLNVTRSVICEMLGALLEKGWVKRVRAADSRTWLVTLTDVGREIFRRCFEETVNNGSVVFALEPGLEKCGGTDTLTVRETLWWYCEHLLEAFRTRRSWFGEDLYLCNPEDYYAWFIEPGERSYELPWANDVPVSELDVEMDGATLAHWQAIFSTNAELPSAKPR